MSRRDRDPFAPGGLYSKAPLALVADREPVALCNICERPATMHIGAGPRCDVCQYHEGQTIAELRAERARIDRVIALRTAWRAKP